jgi:hypothetical protein
METCQNSINCSSENPQNQCDCPHCQDSESKEVPTIVSATVVGLVLGGLYVLLSERSQKKRDTKESNAIANNAMYEVRQNIINTFRA